MDIEFTFQAGNDNGSYDDLRGLYHYLTGDQELRKYVRMSPEPKSVSPGEQGAMEVLTVVSAAAAVGQLAFAVQAWRDGLKRPTTVELLVSGEHQENARQVVEAWHGSGQPEVRHEMAGAGAVGGNGVGRIDPAKSACVLIGTDHYDDRQLPSLRAVHHNLQQLSEVLTDENIWGVRADRIRVVRNPSTSTELIQPIREMSELATDTLIVYQAGDTKTRGVACGRDSRLLLQRYRDRWWHDGSRGKYSR